jgi:phosphoglycerate dehydrogenase-like enzyme
LSTVFRVTITVLVPSDAGLAALSGVDGVTAVRYHPGQPWPPEAKQATVLIPAFLSAEDVARASTELPELAYVQLLSAGAELWAGKLPPHVALSTCRGAHGGSTSEWAVAALLAIYRDFGAFAGAQRRHEWSYHETETLQDKRVLIVGAGDLGQQLANRLAVFDARVTMVGRTARPGVYGFAELPGLLGVHDAVALTVPLTSETIRIADSAFLARMPDGAVLINAARGAVVDTAALVAELRRGRLRAALDVTDPEPLPADHPLWAQPGLLLTPHVAGSVTGWQNRAWQIAATEIARFAAGQTPRNLVHGEY